MPEARAAALRMHGDLPGGTGAGPRRLSLEADRVGVAGVCSHRLLHSEADVRRSALRKRRLDRCVFILLWNGLGSCSAHGPEDPRLARIEHPRRTDGGPERLELPTYLLRRQQVKLVTKDTATKATVLDEFRKEDSVQILTDHARDKYCHSIRYYRLLAPRSPNRVFTSLYRFIGQTRRPRPRPLSWTELIKKIFQEESTG
jgi:hypothetical protein